MPTFVIIGAQRCGTTSLYRYLLGHPRIAPATRKELHFFDHHERFARGIGWYRDQFAAVSLGRPVSGESTPYYLFHPHAPRRLATLAPRTKLIVLLRNPVDRAYSHYQHEVRRGDETLSFEDALDSEEQRLDGEVERMLEDETYRSFHHQHHSYLHRGHYAEQLTSWLSLFPRDQILILKSEDFYSRPDAVFRAVTSFLGLPSAPLTNRRAYNDEGYPPMQPATREQLTGFFRDQNRNLSALIGDDFTWNGS